jgi:thioredoxin reductase
MTPQVVIVGGGPAGLAAAAAAAGAGASTLVLDEQRAAGGRLRYEVQPVVATPGAPAERPSALVERLRADALAAGAVVQMGTVVSACFAGPELLVVEGDAVSRIMPNALIVATGSTDLPFPFSGATLPGVLTARATQILINEHRVRPGRRFAIIGGDELAETLTVDILLAGGEVVWSGVAPAPFLRGEGKEGVTALIVGQERVDVDVVVIAVGRQADAALATMAGVPLGFTAPLGGLVPLVDMRMRSSVAGLFAAGDAAGPGSVAAAISEGRLAGTAAAAELGLATDDEVRHAFVAGGPEVAARAAMRANSSPLHQQPYEPAEER